MWRIFQFDLRPDAIWISPVTANNYFMHAAVVIRTPVGDTYVVDGDDTNHGTEDEVTISGNSDAYIRWRIPSNTTIHIAE
jgi:hypothetical protein